MNLYFVTILLITVAAVSAQPQCVTFCNSLQILMGTCERECPTPGSSTERPTTTPRSRRTTTVASACGDGMNFCTTPNQTVATTASECFNGTMPLRLTWSNLATILQTGTASGITNGTDTASLASFFTNLGSRLSRA